jgi:hypothetical protein
MSGKRLLWLRIGALVLGAAFIIGGLLYSTGEPRCGDQPMKPGAVCTDISSGKAVDRSYDDLAGNGRTIKYVLLAVGAILLIGAIVTVVRSSARTPEAAA